MKTYWLIISHQYDRGTDDYNVYFKTSDIDNSYTRLKSKLDKIDIGSLFNEFSEKKFLELIKNKKTSFGEPSGHIYLYIQDLTIINLDE